jgi:VIT1/CCC1 family predicted Fe2+/Mn2+ transporter
VVATGLAIFAIGAAKSRWSLAGWAKSGLETFLIGMAAAGLAFLIGFGLRAFVKVPI